MTPLLTIAGLKVHYSSDSGLLSAKQVVRAVDGLDLEIAAGDILGLVGESGCGKTTVARCVVRITKPTAGNIAFEGRAVASLEGDALLAYRRSVQMVFQDPYDSLNPRRTIGQTIAYPLRLHTIVPKAEIGREVARLLEWVGLSPASTYADRYPHQFSGGQRQRVGIARALATRPQLIIADEPVSALDISIRAQILGLFSRMSQEFGLACLFISHDLGVVRSLCTRIAVMYLGKIVETGEVDRVFEYRRHPYTACLIDASPSPHRRDVNDTLLRGETPSATSPPSGCHFHPRCPYAVERCRIEEPPLIPYDDQQSVACHRAAEAALWNHGLPAGSQLA